MGFHMNSHCSQRFILFLLHAAAISPFDFHFSLETKEILSDMELETKEFSSQEA